MAGGNSASGEVFMKYEKSRNLILIEDMLYSIDKILKYLGNVQSMEEFLANEMLVDAVTRNFEIIGEAANKVPSDLKAKYPEIPWRQMYGLRNFAVHDYHIIDPVILWEIARDNLPGNKAELEELLKTERKLL